MLSYPIGKQSYQYENPGRLACLHQNQEEHVVIAHAQSGVLVIPVAAGISVGRARSLWCYAAERMTSLLDIPASFRFIKDWVQKKIRRRVGRSPHRRGFSWKRWSTRWLHEEPTLSNGYRVRRAAAPKARPASAGAGLPRGCKQDREHAELRRLRSAMNRKPFWHGH
jgi:hypothetical protein